MTMDASRSDLGRHIDIPSVPNMRDLGGYPTASGGRVRTGLLFRSADLSHLHGDDLETFSELGIRTVFDMRTVNERSAAPDVLPEGTALIVCDVLKDSPGLAPAELLKLLSDPARVEQAFGDGKAVPMFEESFRELVSLPSALAAYRTFFTALADEGHRPALSHCITGKDRTGWAAAAILLLLGVSEEDVEYDFELTNRDLLPAMKPMLERFRAAGGDPRLLDPVLAADPLYLHAALDEMKTQYGTIENYFAQGLGIDEDGQQALRNALTETD